MGRVEAAGLANQLQPSVDPRRCSRQVARDGYSIGHGVMRRDSSNLEVNVGRGDEVLAPTLNHVSTTVPTMKTFAAVVLLVLVSTGCAAKGGTTVARGPARQIDLASQADHGEFSRPIGQR